MSVSGGGELLQCFGALFGLVNLECIQGGRFIAAAVLQTSSRRLVTRINFDLPRASNIETNQGGANAGQFLS
jgi:hypothetical protein